MAIAWATLMTCGLRGESVVAQDLLILGQSPTGPLLDDAEPANWLDNVSIPGPAGGGISDSVVGGSFASGAPLAPDSPAPAADGFDQNNANGGVGWDSYPSGDSVYGEAGCCPDCGGSVAGVYSPCLSGVCAGNGSMSRGMMGLHRLARCQPIAEWQELLQPMDRESWLFRPFSAGWFMGSMYGNELVKDWVGQKQGFFGGYRFGWDTDPYWGYETRFGFASVALYDSDRAKAAQSASDIAAGLTSSDARYYRFDTRRDSGIQFWDVDLLWYPFGDTYLRPYFLLGLGAARVDFMDRLSDRRIKSVFAMPIAIGIKYRVRDWVALRLEATDNFIAGAGSGFQNLHNFSLTFGLEVRFGGRRTAYWPYYPGRHYW